MDYKLYKEFQGMEQGGFIYDARGNFERFVKSSREPEHGKDRYLQYYLQHWLEFGNGVEYTGERFENFLRVALDIADAAMRGAIEFDYVGTPERNHADRRHRKVIAIHDHDEDAEQGLFADRMAYEVIAYRRRRGRVGR